MIIWTLWIIYIFLNWIWGLMGLINCIHNLPAFRLGVTVVLVIIGFSDCVPVPYKSESDIKSLNITKHCFINSRVSAMWNRYYTKMPGFVVVLQLTFDIDFSLLWNLQRCQRQRTSFGYESLPYRDMYVGLMYVTLEVYI